MVSQANDIYLLCSDGLTGMITENEILELVSDQSEDLESACRQLIDLANEHGGMDNITAVLVKAL
jgi:protein phosphatase